MAKVFVPLVLEVRHLCVVVNNVEKELLCFPACPSVLPARGGTVFLDPNVDWEDIHSVGLNFVQLNGERNQN